MKNCCYIVWNGLSWLKVHSVGKLDVRRRLLQNNIVIDHEEGKCSNARNAKHSSKSAPVSYLKLPV